MPTTNEVKAYLDGLPMSDRLRAAAWDAMFSGEDVKTRLDALPLPDAAKAQLWDYAHANYDEQAGPEGSATGRFLSNAGAMINPLTIAQGLYQTVRHPIDTASAVIGAQADQFTKAGQAQSPLEAAGHVAAGVLPVLGPMAANAGEQIASGDVAGGLGAGTGLLASFAGGPAATRAVGKVVGAPAERLVRSAVKPTVTAMRQRAGASVTGINAQADRLVKYITDRGITSPAHAERIIAKAESAIQAAASGSKVATDAPQRAQRYLDALERSAKRQGLPADDVATIRSKAAELFDTSPLSEDVTTAGTKAAPMGDQMAGGPKTVPAQVTTRELRTDVMPDEALELARGGGRWGNRKQWGEQKGAAVEANKAVERAERDAVKAAVPETKPLLREQGQAIESKKVLDRMQFREANREPVSPFDITTAAVEMGTTGVPVMGIARHFLRGNKLKMGVWARRLERAIQTHDEATAALILDRFGVSKAAAGSEDDGR